jgi:hypothetical protein
MLIRVPVIPPRVLVLLEISEGQMVKKKAQKAGT